MNQKKIAIIDMGSNSIRLVINSIQENGRYKELYNFKVVARLSSHIHQGALTRKGQKIMIESLQQFSTIIDYHQVNEVIGIATAAVRNAANQGEIIQTIKKETGYDFRVLSEYEEAYYGYLAIINSTNIEEGISIDIGGGSTEVTLFKNRELLHFHSFPFGAITLQQQFITSDTPTEKELAQLNSYLMNQISTLPWLVNCHLPLIGIGGSARNLSLIHQKRINYPLAGLHQFEFQRKDIQEIQELLISLPLSARQSVDGLSKDRADIIIPAVQTILTVATLADSPRFIMSNKGLRDGVFYTKIFEELGFTHFQNVADESFYQLTSSYDINLSNVKQVAKIASSLYKELFSYVQLDSLDKESDTRLLYYSAQVLYLGEFINREASSQHTFYLLTNMTIEGLTHEDRLAIAFISSFKSKAMLQRYAGDFKTMVSKEKLKKYEYLGAILKLAYGLNRTRRNVIETCTVSKYQKNHFTFHLTCRGDFYFEEQQANKYKKHLEKVLTKNIELQLERVSI